MKLKPMYMLLTAALTTVSLNAWAFDAFTVRDIRVEGLQRTDAAVSYTHLTLPTN